MIAIVESPYKYENRDMLLRNTRYAQLICRFLTTKMRYNTFASHLFYTQFLNDDDSTERTSGMCYGLDMTMLLCEHAEVIWVWGLDFGPSEGMMQAHTFAYDEYKHVPRIRFYLSVEGLRYFVDTYAEYVDSEHIYILEWMDRIISMGTFFRPFERENINER